MKIEDLKDILISKKCNFVILGSDTKSEHIITNLLNDIGSFEIKNLNEKTNIEQLVRSTKLSYILDDNLDNLDNYKNFNVLNIDINNIVIKNNSNPILESKLRSNLLRKISCENNKTLILKTQLYIAPGEVYDHKLIGGKSNLFVCDLAIKIINNELIVVKNRHYNYFK